MKQTIRRNLVLWGMVCKDEKTEPWILTDYCFFSKSECDKVRTKLIEEEIWGFTKTIKLVPEIGNLKV